MIGLKDFHLEVTTVRLSAQHVARHHLSNDSESIYRGIWRYAREEFRLFRNSSEISCLVRRDGTAGETKEATEAQAQAVRRAPYLVIIHGFFRSSLV